MRQAAIRLVLAGCLGAVLVLQPALAQTPQGQDVPQPAPGDAEGAEGAEAPIFTFGPNGEVIFEEEAPEVDPETIVENVHVLAIASGHGAGAPERPEVLSSATMVINTLKKRFAARTAVLLRSDEKRFVTARDVGAALAYMNRAVQMSFGEDLVIVYVVAPDNRIAWQPGAVVAPGAAQEHVVPLGDLVGRLGTLPARHMLMVDALTGDAAMSGDAFSGDPRAAFTMASGPVLLAAPPGRTLESVYVPNATGLLRKRRIGPLARRLIKAVNDLPGEHPVTVDHVLETLGQADLDSVTNPPVTMALWSDVVGLSAPGPFPRTRVFFGTGTADRLVPVEDMAGAGGPAAPSDGPQAPPPMQPR